MSAIFHLLRASLWVTGLPQSAAGMTETVSPYSCSREHCPVEPPRLTRRRLRSSKIASSRELWHLDGTPGKRVARQLVRGSRSAGTVTRPLRLHQIRSIADPRITSCNQPVRRLTPCLVPVRRMARTHPECATATDTHRSGAVELSPWTQIYDRAGSRPRRPADLGALRPRLVCQRRTMSPLRPAGPAGPVARKRSDVPAHHAREH